VQVPQVDPLIVGIDVEFRRLAGSDEGYPSPIRRLDREIDGAETAQTIGIARDAAFWTISKETRPLTMRIRWPSGIAFPSTCEPTSLSSALCRPTSSRIAMSSPAGEKRPAA